MPKNNSSLETYVLLERFKDVLKPLQLEANTYYTKFISAFAVYFSANTLLISYIISTTRSLIHEGLIHPGTTPSDEIVKLIYTRVSGVFIILYAVIALVQAYLVYRAYRLGKAYSGLLSVLKEARGNDVRVLERLGIFREDVEKAVKMLDDTPRVLLVTGLISVATSYSLLLLLLNTIITEGVTGIQNVLVLSTIVSTPLSIYLGILYYILFRSIDLGLGPRGSAALSILFLLLSLITGFDIVYKAYTLQLSSNILGVINTIITLIIIGFLHSFRKSLEEFPEEINKAIEWVEGNIGGYRGMTSSI